MPATDVHLERFTAELPVQRLAFQPTPLQLGKCAHGLLHVQYEVA
jgi:hypothetical protein